MIVSWDSSLYEEEGKKLDTFQKRGKQTDLTQEDGEKGYFMPSY